MIKILINLISLILILFSASNAAAYNVSKVYSDDENNILGITTNYDDGITKELLVMETYGESQLLSDGYPGSAVVNGQYFDSVFSFDTDDVGYYEVALRIKVYNDTPYDWSAYRFEFWNTDFTTQHTNLSLYYMQDASPLTQVSFDGSTLQYSGGTQSQGGYSYFYVGLSPALLPDSLGVRQIANTNTVAPEPISSILFIAGGSLLTGRRYIKRKKAA